MYSTEEVAELLGLFDTSMYLGGMGYMLGRYSNVRRDTFFMKGLGGNFLMTFLLIQQIGGLENACCKKNT